MKIGFIGCGNMATAMIHGIIQSNIAKPEEIMASAATLATLEKAEKTLSIQTSLNNCVVAKDADILFLAVKPQYFEKVINEVKLIVSEQCIIVSIAAGQSIKQIETLFGRSLKIVRTMPNTPAMVNEGITAVCKNENITEDDMKLVMNVFNSFGIAEEVTENLIDAVIAVSGSSPAYIFMLIEAMADAAVAQGMPRKKAYRFAAQAVLGSAKMVLETGKHPGELKDMVCSPGGTTIEAVRVLEKTGFRSSIMEAMKACADRSKNLS